jgi:hypothetical protein
LSRGLTWTVRMCFIFLGWHTKVLGSSSPPHRAAEEDANFLRGARRLWLNPAVMTELQVTC